MSIFTRPTVIAFGMILVSTASTLPAQEVSGGPLSRFLTRIRQHHCTSGYVYQEAAAPAAVAPLPDATAAADCECQEGADPYGFGTILNRHRADAGLQPVSYDPDLSSWAGQNNVAQCHRGLGHHVHPCGVQNCGWNYADAQSVAQGWMNSSGHRQNMLSPSITRFGIAYGPGPYWTLIAR
ncbi:MAG TPA: CAP domain-containing protein [Isosphaeraceae bacterium]|nr:CAP domain-containing protein [Isosphaeraceae bacterium]